MDHQGTALGPREDRWDARGVRVSAVFRIDGQWARDLRRPGLAAENWEERTGLAYAPTTADDGPGVFVAQGHAPVAESPHAGRGLRYLAWSSCPTAATASTTRRTRADGAHELRTELLRPPVRTRRAAAVARG